jgi:hypothetical protein
MIKCIYFYLKILGLFTTTLGIFLFMSTNGAIYSKHTISIGAILVCVAYIFKLFVPVKRVTEWWIVFPELNSNELVMKRERAYNRLKLFYYLSMVLTLAGFVISLFSGYYYGMGIVGIFACCPLVIYLLELWVFKYNIREKLDWSLVYPELAGYYERSTNFTYKMPDLKNKMSDDETAALKIAYLELCELNIELDNLKMSKKIK